MHSNHSVQCVHSVERGFINIRRGFSVGYPCASTFGLPHLFKREFCENRNHGEGGKKGSCITIVLLKIKKK